MRTATVEKFWNSQEDRLAMKSPRCIVTLTERNKVKIWELDLDDPAHCEIERDLEYGKGFTRPFADGRPFDITYTTTRKSSSDLLVNGGEPLSIKTVPTSRTERGLMVSSIKIEILCSLSKEPMTPTHLASDIWLRLEESFDQNPFKPGDDVKVKRTLTTMFEDGTVVKIRRGVYALSVEGKYDLFRNSMTALCVNEPVAIERRDSPTI